MAASTGLPGEEEPQTVSRYRYNGLGFRIMRQDDVDADTTLEADERFFMAYDERWRVVGTFRDQDEDPKEAFIYHAAGFAGMGSSSYIDSVLLRDRDNYTGGTPNGMTSASDGTLEERRYYVQNWRADVVAVTKSDGVPLEYVRYSAYGEPTAHPIADLNLDGVVDTTDADIWQELQDDDSQDYPFRRDLDWSGSYAAYGDDYELIQESYTANVGLSGKGRVSSAGVGNTIGYAGYVWDQVMRANHVRHRVYLPEIGRWTRRDPLGYVDGTQDLYAFVAGSPLRWVDPIGLSRQDPDPKKELERIERIRKSNPNLSDEQKRQLKEYENELHLRWCPQHDESVPRGPWDYDYVNPGATDTILKCRDMAADGAKATAEALMQAPFYEAIGPILSLCRPATKGEMRKLKRHYGKPKNGDGRPTGLFVDKDGNGFWGPKNFKPGERGRPATDGDGDPIKF